MSARAESLLSAERRMLEAIADGVSLVEVLEDLCRTIDCHAPGVISSVALMDSDGKRLWLGAGPRFPAKLKQIAFPWPIGPGRGACGTAAFLKKRVIISDIAVDPRWPDDCRDLPVNHGLRAAWSEPLISKDGAVHGTFAMYYGEPRVPDTSDLELIEAAGHIAKIAIQMERSQTAVRQSEEWLRLAIQAGKMYAFEWDATTGVLVRSPEYVNVLPETEPRVLTHQQAMEKIHPDDRPKLIAAIATHSPKNPTVDLTYRVVLPGKPPIWVRSSGHAFFDGEGRMSRVVGIIANITTQKLAEEALRDSEERLRLAQKVAGIGTFERNIRTGVNTWTAEMESMYGLPPGGFGRTRSAFENLIHPDDRAGVTKLVEEALKTGHPTSGEWRVIWPDGSVHWIAGRWQALVDDAGEPSRVVGANLDITERKQTEEAIKESEKRFRLVANTAPVMIWMSGPDGKPTYFNQLWLDFTGRSEIELQNNLAESVHSDDCTECTDIYRAAFARRRPFQKECRLRRHDGQHRWILDIGVPRFREDGSFAGYIGSCVDITEQKLAEEARAKMSRRLIEVQDQERRFVARELHDDIIQRISLLAFNLKSLEQNLPLSRAVLQEKLAGEYAQVSELASDIDALSRRLHSATLQRLGLTKAAAIFCREFSQREKLQVEFSTDGTLEEIPDAISLCLHRVLQEALHNAAKHSGVKQIAVQLYEKAGEIYLIVSDKGKGFDLESAMRGQGLGLTSMQERVRLIGGTIVIDSKPLAGTTIRVRVLFQRK
jgi:PAS domain S-box-containing protein